MTPRRSREPLIEELRYRLRGYGGVILLILGLTAAAAAMGLFATHDFGQPAVAEVGEVVRFGAYDYDDGKRAVVLVRTGDGQVRQLATDQPSLLRCQRGSTIRLVRRGATYRVDPHGCPARRQP